MGTTMAFYYIQNQGFSRGRLQEILGRSFPKEDNESFFDSLKLLLGNICCFTGTLDAIAPPWMVKPLWSRLPAHKGEAVQRLVELPSAHGFCGSRIAVIRETASFLDAVLSRPMPAFDGAFL